MTSIWHADGSVYLSMEMGQFANTLTCFFFVLSNLWVFNLSGKKKDEQDRCHQWSIRPDQHSCEQRTLFSLDICLVLESGDGRTNGSTDGQHVRKQLSLPAVTLGRPRGSTQKYQGSRSPKSIFCPGLGF